MSQTPNQKNIVLNSTINAHTVHIGDKITYVINERKLEIPVRLTNFIPTDASHVVGRDDELAETHQKLSNNKPTVLVNGIGGIGKTTLALKYMVAYTPQYQHVAWLNAAAGVQSAFIQDTALLDALHLRRDVEDCINAAQPDKAFDLVFKRLNDLAQNTEGGKQILIVLDNANDLADLLAHKKYFDTAQIHFLITSRANPEGWQMVKVESLPKEQALELFKNIYPSVLATDEALDTVLSQLFYHTLLIELVAKAVASAGLSFVELQTMIDTRFIHHQELNEEIITSGKHGDSLPENIKRTNIEDYIWLIFNNVCGLDDKSKDILRGIALLPLGMTVGRNNLKKFLAILDIEDVVRSLTLLVERGWLDLVRTEDGKPAYEMHPLIADVVKKHLELNVAFAEAYINSIAELIHYDSLNPMHNLFEKNIRRPFAERLSDLFFEENSERVSYLHSSLNLFNQNLATYQTAIESVECALEILESLLDENHPIIAETQNHLANLYEKVGKNEQAVALLEAALASDLKNFGYEHPKVAVNQSDLAIVYGKVGKNEQAVALLEAALASDLKNFGYEHPKVAIVQSRLAIVYWNSDKNEQAAALLEAALANNLKNFGIEHPEVASNQRSLAQIYIYTNRKPEAKVLLQTAYQYFLKNLGAEHPHTIEIQKWFPYAE